MKPANVYCLGNSGKLFNNNNLDTVHKFSNLEYKGNFYNNQARPKMIVFFIFKEISD